MIYLHDEKEMKESNKKEYLVKYKGYKICEVCTELVDPRDKHYNLSLCDECYEKSFKKF